MKKSYLTLCFLFSVFFSFASGEKVCVYTPNGEKCTPNDLGFIDPCARLKFVANFQVLPAGFDLVAKYEWFVNGVSVKTSTSSLDPILEWDLKTAINIVFVKITYKKLDGTLSPVYPSTSFTPDIKELNFANSGITATSPLPGINCTSNAANFILNPYTCQGSFCSTIYNASSYNITWLPPSGWTQVSISPNGNNVSFLPDATTEGALTAIITLPCGYIETRTYQINRGKEKPKFSTSIHTSCSSPSTYLITPVCGASNYTYTIEGNTGIKFAVNGQQTLTTSDTSVALTFPTGDYSFALKVKANYPNNIASEEESIQLFYGMPSIDLVTFSNGANTDQYFCTNQYGENQLLAFFSSTPESGTLQYRVLSWPSLNVVFTDPYSYPLGSPIPVNYMAQPGSYAVIEIKLTTHCGTSEWMGFEVEYVDCSVQRSCADCQFNLSASPNPATDDLTVSIEKRKPEVKALSKNDKVRYMLYDMNQGQMVKQWTFDNSQDQRKLYVRGINPGQYVLLVIIGKYRQTKQVFIR